MRLSAQLGPQSAAQPGTSLLSCFASGSEAPRIFSSTGSSIIPLFLKRGGHRGQEVGQPPEETDRWRFNMMGKVETMLGSITENQEGNSSVFLYVFIYWNSNGFSSLCESSG